MRNPNRLYNFYDTLRVYHMRYFPDWRFGQLIENFELWLHNTKKITDKFYIEEDKILEYMNEFIKDMVE